MTRLSVNINKIATLRNARSGNLPDVLEMAKDCERFGAEGITVHPRPDARHITYEDVEALAPVLNREFNIEGYPSSSFLTLVLKICPQQVTLVPDPPDAITSDAGWDTVKHELFLKKIIKKLQEKGIRTSLFVDTSIRNIRGAKKTGTDRIEFYTGPYASGYMEDKEKAIQPYVEAALVAKELGLGVNAGHDLNLTNLTYFKQNIPHLLEVSIGHALICDSLYFGIHDTIVKYKYCLT